MADQESISSQQSEEIPDELFMEDGSGHGSYSQCSLIDKFLEAFASSTHGDMEGRFFWPRLLDQPGKSFQDYTTPSRPPTAAFHSEYIGKTPEELTSIFNTMNADKSSKVRANLVFLILDAQTIEDETVCGVITIVDPCQTLRAAFDCAGFILLGTDVDWATFDDGPFSILYERGEAVTEESWNEQKVHWRKAQKEVELEWKLEREQKALEGQEG